MAAARDQKGGKENVVCVFGDAALTNGCSFEALNNIAQTTKKFIGILNDNEWSIAKNVGAIPNYLNKLITNPSYNKITTDLQKFLEKIPTGKLAVRLGLKGQEALKGTVTQAVLEHRLLIPNVQEREESASHSSMRTMREQQVTHKPCKMTPTPGFCTKGPMDGIREEHASHQIVRSTFITDSFQGASSCEPRVSSF